jgi:predicted transcriptional regulator
MSDNFRFTKAAIEWRRNAVFSKLAKGYSQADIAKELQLHPSTISLDVQYLKEQAQRELRVHIKEVLPFEYSRAITGINDLLKRATEMLERTTDPQMRLKTMTLVMELYRSVMSMATDRGVVESAMKMVKGLESQNTSEVKMSSDKKEDEGEEEDFEDEEINIENDEEIINEEEQELREE